MTSDTVPAAAAQSRGASRAAAILDATLQLLGEVGYDQLSIDAVAARARSSKATIYRRWTDKSSLVCAALISASERHPELPSGATSLREDLLALIALLAKVATVEDPGAFASLLAAAQKDPAIATAVRATAVEPRRRNCRDVIQRAIGRGELSDPGLATVLFETAIGQMMVRFLLQSDGFDDARQIDFVDNTLIPALKAHDMEARRNADH
ncbi:TetR/AcrR family transcriptional regulator [Mycobacterium sp. 663a-19]|uniref:TetR/AcrR family transcriptional regulator n=1 Tax=Mycobacterium sp. 663a-19 TaxID=2986148 RepID=UPI002D1F671C|nr:TetR/AcrR family transcriptional regulator [Mycobacterium sp. 663a-19]MEB3980093.1 TetR/AcrR family transcriptional regulator [Mycobacterium sp. 663a-19]